MSQKILAAALTAAFAAAPFGAALADRAPTAYENAEIGNVLFAEGYSSWGKIEFDDGVWEVENAIDQDGKKRDVKLNESLIVIDSEADD